MVRKLLKRSISPLLIPLTRWYLRKERSSTVEGITVRVQQGVFHPGLFSSTRFLLDYLKDQPLAGKSFLELGCGTGLISVFAANRGASVTASDLSLKAVTNARLNAAKAKVSIVHSDLFEKITGGPFDWIVINPPYYAKDAANETELAWHCGSDFQYFKKLFSTMLPFSKPAGMIIMVLTKGCDVVTIESIAKRHGWRMELLREKNVLFDEKDFLFRLVAKQGADSN